MSNISESLLQAFDVVMEERLSKLRYDKSIQATIKNIQDIAIGKYSVEYTGGIFDAYSENLELIYKVGDLVWVTIPEGDFSNKKLIRNKVTSVSTSTAQKTELQNSIFEVSPNFSDLGYIYTNFDSEGKVGLAIYHDNSRPEFDSISIGGTGSTDFLHRFSIYANLYEYILVSAEFKTEFLRNHSKGDYGLLLGFENTSGLSVAYTMNLRNFNGNPYALTTWSPQSTILKIPKGLLSNLSSIVFYQENFDNMQEPPEHSPSSPNEKDELYNTPNLFMRNISLSFVEVEDLTERPYYLNIIALNGILFTTATTSLTLKGLLYYYGEVVTSNCVYLWYKQDLSITSASEEYDKRAGWGWRPLNGENRLSVTINKSNVPWETTYKLVVVHDEETLVEKEITLINYNSIILLAIVLNNENSSVILLLSNTSYRGNWYYVSSDGNLHNILNGTNVSSVNVTNYLVYSPMTFYCSVDGVGTLSYIMRNFESEKDVSVTFAGENLFSYDANGDIDIRDADTEKRLEVTTIWNNGVISSDCVVEWLDGEGNPIPDGGSDPYCNGNSMIATVRIVLDTVDSNRKILYYKVKHKFKVYPELNNSFRIRITPRGQDPIFFVKQIYFTKTGDPGTNGTTYQALITTNKKFLVNGSTINLTCLVYKDLTPVENLGITPTITWTLNGLTGGVSGKTITVGNIDTSNYMRYAEATIKINDSGNITLYSFVPIYTASSNIDVDLSMLPKYVLYGSNGLNPSFLRLKISEMPFTILATTNVSIVDNYLKFSDTFDAANHVALIRLAAAGTTIYYPIPMYANTFGNEAINSWDGVNIGLDDQNRAILAPLVGAGTKNASTNKFTGVVMGKDPGQSRVGLYGYHDGINSFGLMDNGRAYFGDEGKYRITINPEDGTLLGGLGGSDDAGMTITLAKKTSSTKDSDAIRVGAGNFIVTYGGNITANGAVIRGTLSAGSGSRLGCTFNDNGTAKNDGWEITNDTILSGNFYLSSKSASDTYTFLKGKTYYDSYYIIESSIALMGDHTAETNLPIDAFESFIPVSGITLYRFKFRNEDTWHYCSFASDVTNDTYRIWSGTSPNKATFFVTNKGYLYAENAQIKGSIEAKTGYIGDWEIKNNRILNSDGTIFLSPTLFKLGSKFSVTGTGVDVEGKIIATSGSIGGWNITKRTKNGVEVSTLLAGSTYLDSDGYLRVNDGYFSGTISAATISGGTITGTSISAATITSGVILGDAYIYGNTIEAGTISSTEISASTITGGTITGADIYASKFYAISGDTTKYLLITLSGITHHAGGSNWWSIGSSGSGLLVSTSLQGFTVIAEGDITLDTSASNSLVKLSGRVALSENHGYGSSLPSYGSTGQIFFVI